MDTLIDSLFENIDLLDLYEIEDFGEGEADEVTSESMSLIPSSISDSDSHSVLVKKRKYEWKSSESVKRGRFDSSRYQRIVLPRILKNDIRRRYSMMYANVMNSYDFDLISSFFLRFMKPDLRFEKKCQIGPGPLTLVSGVDVVIKYFLVLLQGSPDKITKVSDITIKQSSVDRTRTEVTCKFSVHNSIVYELYPEVFHSIIEQFLVKTPKIALDSSLHSGQRKSRSLTNENEIEKEKEEAQKAKLLFDPISGDFLSKRFRRLDSPKIFRVEGYMTFVVNEEKWIESILIERMSKAPWDGNHYHCKQEPPAQCGKVLV